MSTSQDQRETYNRLVAYFRVPPDNSGEVWGPCPNCEREDKKFSFSPRGFKCFVCGFSGRSLSYLAYYVRAPRAFVPYRVEQRKKKDRPQQWQLNPRKVLEGFKAYPNKGELWRRYRPFTDEIIERYELGVGVLPSCRCVHLRLIYPAYKGTQIVGLRGRASGCDCEKWLVSKGTKVVLWSSDYPPFIEPDRLFIVCESPIDGMLAKMLRPKIVTVASTGGAGTWRDEWTEQIASLLPSLVLVWLDNDLPGNATGATRARLLAGWREKMAERGRGNIRPPVANGMRITNAFLAHHVQTRPYIWPESAPAKMDLSEFLMEGLP